MTNNLLLSLTERTTTEGNIAGENCVVSNFDAGSFKSVESMAKRSNIEMS